MSSSASESTLRDRARQGDCAAIAYLINRAFQKEAIQAEVRTQKKELIVTLQAETAPQKRYVRPLVQGIQRLGVSGVTHLTVESYAADVMLPDWVETLQVPERSPTGRHTDQPPQQSAFMAQWHQFRRAMPPPLQSSAVLIGFMAVVWVLLVLHPLAIIAALLVFAGWWWPRHPHQRQSWPPRLRNLPNDFWLFRWGWVATVLLGYALLTQQQLLAYPVLLSLMALWCKGLFSLLIQHRRGGQDIWLMGSLHLLFVLIALQLGFSIMEPALYLKTLIGVGALPIFVLGALGRNKAAAIGGVLIILTAVLLFVAVFLLTTLTIYADMSRRYADPGEWTVVVLLPILLVVGLPSMLVLFVAGVIILRLSRPNTPYPAVRGGLMLVGVYASWMTLLSTFR
ncbi:MAG: hypothetical protein ACFB0C_13845 [Leptolyngbyaceae cyanobacterium]